MDLTALTNHLVAAAVFSLLGVVVFLLALWLFARCVPFSLRKEVEEDQNIAVGVIVGSMIIGLSMIIAAAISG